MNKTWITVSDTAVNGWAEGPQAPADGWIQFAWRPEKSFEAYEYDRYTCRRQARILIQKPQKMQKLRLLLLTANSPTAF